MLCAAAVGEVIFCLRCGGTIQAAMDRVRGQLDKVFVLHAAAAIIIGGLAVISPHSVAATALGDNGHLTHEMLRLYGCLTVAQGWLVWQTRKISDAFVRKTFCQAYCFCFALQALVLLKAQVSSPENHTLWHWLNILILMTLCGLYGYFLYKPMKVFTLPGGVKEYL